MAISGSLLGRAVDPAGGPVSYYAARRYYDQSNSGVLTLCFYSGLRTNPSFPARQESWRQLAVLTNGAGFIDDIVFSPLPPDVTNVAWSEFVPRTELPILTYVSSVTDDTTYGTVLPTTVAEYFDQPRILFQGGIQWKFKNAMTRNGFIMIDVQPNPSNPSYYDVTFKLVTGYLSNAFYNTSPPYLPYLNPVDPVPSNCTDIATYATQPFSGSSVSNITYAGGNVLDAINNPNAYFISYDGSITFVVHKGSDPGYDTYAYRYTSPVQLSASTASGWVTSSYPVASSTGPEYQGESVVRCNNGVTVVRLIYTKAPNPPDPDEPIQLVLRTISSNFSSSSAITIDQRLAFPILPDEYGSGVMYAFDTDKLMWFSNETVASQACTYYRVIDTTSLTCTAPSTTGFTFGLRDLRYLGFSASGRLYVALVYDVDVDVVYYTGGTWSGVVDNPQFATNTAAITTLLVDTIESAGSALLVAVLSDGGTLYQEILMT